MKHANVLIEMGFFDERPMQRIHDAVVDLGPRTILVEWREGGRLRRYEGVRSGQGHFLLRSDDGAVSASLHRFQYGEILEGSWERRRGSGFWRIHLPQTRIPRIARLGARISRRRRMPLAA